MKTYACFRIALSVVLCLAFSLGAGAQSYESRIAWHTDIKEAFKVARKQQKPVMVEFMAEWCPSCRMMEDSTFIRPAVIESAERFVPVRIDVDKQKAVTEEYKSSARKYGGIGIPNILFMTRDGRKLKHRIGYMDKDAFIAVMDSVLAEAK
jgi:thiol:disulfide interchange protein